jgi:hypothetical protein
MRSSVVAHPRGHHTRCFLEEATRCSLRCSFDLFLRPHRSGDAYPLPQAGRGREHEGSAQAVPPSIASLLVARPQLCRMTRSTTAASLDTRTGTGIKPRAMPRDSWSRRDEEGHRHRLELPLTPLSWRGPHQGIAPRKIASGSCHTALHGPKLVTTAPKHGEVCSPPGGIGKGRDGPPSRLHFSLRRRHSVGMISSCILSQFPATSQPASYWTYRIPRLCCVSRDPLLSFRPRSLSPRN